MSRIHPTAPGGSWAGPWRGSWGRAWRRTAWTAYEICWLLVAGLCLVVGLLVLVERPFSAVLGSWLICAALIAMGRAMLSDAEQLDSLRGVMAVLWFGARWGAAACCLAALSLLLGGAGLVLALTVAATSPDLVRAVRRRVGRHLGVRASPRRRPGPGGGRPGAPSVSLSEPVLVVPDHLTDEDLCHAWRSSYTALTRTRTTAGLLRAVEIRALILDELERRDRAGLVAWLHSGARPAGDPSRYLTH